MSTPLTDPPSLWFQADEEDCDETGRMLEVVGLRWSPSVLLALARGATRFGEITALTRGLSRRMLSVRLRQLETAGLVERSVVPTTPVTVRYRLSERGEDLVASIRPLAGFVRRWSDVGDRVSGA